MTSEQRQAWGWMDTRTGRRVSNSACSTQEQAVREVAFWRERDAKGGRPDIHDLIPHIVVVRLDDRPWCSVGDVVQACGTLTP